MFKVQKTATMGLQMKQQKGNCLVHWKLFTVAFNTVVEKSMKHEKTNFPFQGIEALLYKELFTLII